LTLSALLTHLELTAAHVAVERNREIVPRDQWNATQILEGDKLEIVHLVGGG
jgi:thiamine biosynthesis protein ThiS